MYTHFISAKECIVVLVKFITQRFSYRFLQKTG